MLDLSSAEAVAAVLGAVGAGLANEAGKAAWESAGGLVRRIVGHEVRAPRDRDELSGVAQLVHDAVRQDPGLATAWTAFARSAPRPGDADLRPVLRASTRFFTDRESERKALSREASRRADGRPRVAVLHGPQGIGTSALALHWGCAELRRFPDGQLYADLRGAGPAAGADPSAVLGSLLGQLGVPAAEVPPTREDREALLRACTTDRRLLIVLDHARSAAQILPVLTSAPGVFVIVTARHPLPGLDAVGIPLRALSDKDARRLLAEVTKAGNVTLDRAALPAVLERCAGSPFALRAAAARLTARHWQQDGQPSGDAARTAVADGIRALRPDAARALRLLAQRDWPAIDAPMAGAVLGIDGDGRRTRPGRAGRRPPRGERDQRHVLGQTPGPGVRGDAGTQRGGPRSGRGGRPRGGAVVCLLRRTGEQGGPTARMAAGRTAAACTGRGTVYRCRRGADRAARQLGTLLQAIAAAEELGDADAVFRLNQALWPLQLKMGCHDELLPALDAGVRVTRSWDPTPGRPRVCRPCSA